MQIVVVGGQASYTLFPVSAACSDVLRSMNDAYMQANPTSTHRFVGCSSDPVAYGTYLSWYDGSVNGYLTVTSLEVKQAVSVTEWSVQSLLVVVAIVFALLLGFRTGYRA